MGKVGKDRDGFLWLLGLRIANFTPTCLLQAPERNWSASRYRCVALHRTRTWGITRDEQGYHHLPPTPQPWDTRQMKVASSLDTTSTLATITLVSARNICLYQESATRVSTTGMDDEPANK
jgi:hypothetical protein